MPPCTILKSLQALPSFGVILLSDLLHMHLTCCGNLHQDIHRSPMKSFRKTFPLTKLLSVGRPRYTAPAARSLHPASAVPLGKPLAAGFECDAQGQGRRYNSEKNDLTEIAWSKQQPVASSFVGWRLLLSSDMRLVFGYQKSLELLTRGGFASTSIAQNRVQSFQQQEPVCLLSRKLQRKVSNMSELGTHFNVSAPNVIWRFACYCRSAPVNCARPLA